jgi:hypothetical protein
LFSSAAVECDPRAAARRGVEERTMEIITGIIGLIYVSLAWLFSSIGDNRMGLAALIIMMLLLGSQAVLDAIFQELYRKRM